MTITRRLFVRTCMLALGGCAGLLLSGRAEARVPQADGLSCVAAALGEKSRALPDLLREWGWTHADGPTGGGWKTSGLSVLGATLPASLVLLGEERGASGRAMTPEKLEAGMPVQASSLSFALAASPEESDLTDIAGRLRSTCGIADGAVLEADEPTASPVNAANPYAAHFEVCSCAVRGEQAVWWLTMFGHARTEGLTCSLGMALLDYYARSRLVRPAYADVVAAGSPWDIPTDKEFRALSASEAYELGLLDAADAK